MNLFLAVAVLAAAPLLSPPAYWIPQLAAPAEGYLDSGRFPAGIEACQPGAICASAKLNRHGCFFVNAASDRLGGSPLAIDATESGPSAPTSVYWVNDTNQIVIIRQAADAYYRCPR